MSLVLLNDYKEILHIEGSDEDEFIGLLAQESESYIENYLNFSIMNKEYVDVVDGNGTNMITLPNSPVQSVSKIEYYEGLNNSNNEIWTTLQLGIDYERVLIYHDRVILDGNVFYEGIKNYRITYNAGYNECPADIQNACKKMVKLLYNELKKKDSVGISSVSQSSGYTNNISFEKDDFNKILLSVSYYRRLNV